MIETIKIQIKGKSLFIKCIAASLLLHFMLLYFFYKHPVALYAASFFNKTKPSPTSVYASANIEELESEREETLAEAFDNIILLPKGMEEPYDLVSVPPSVAMAPNLEDSLQLFSPNDQIQPVEISAEELQHLESQDLFMQNDEIASSMALKPEASSPLMLTENLYSVLEDSFQATQNLLPEIAFIDDTHGDSSIFTEEKEFHEEVLPSQESLSARKEFPSQNSFVEDLSSLKTPTDTARIPSSIGDWGKREITKNAPSKLDATISDREFIVPYAHPGLSSIEEDQILELASVATWNDDFEVAVAVSPAQDQSGYIFSLSLSPKHNMVLEKIQQNFYFLIDASSSIDKHRFGLFKRAVLKSLASLQEGDRFNIIILDKKLTRLSKNNLMYNLKSMHLAEDFLQKLSQANFITSVDLIESLEKVAASISDVQQMHTALLLTNGHCSQGFQNQQKSLKAYLEKNANKLSLYAAAVGNKNNIVNLDMICNLSGGRLLYSDTNASFPRKFSELVKSLRNPIAKDIHISAVASHPKAGLSILSTNQQLPAMYAGEPYIIMGKIERLSDISLTIEARHDDEWISINKNISFQQASSNNSLAVDWDKSTDVNTQYQGFLKDPKAKYIKQAREILKSTHGKAALE